MATVEVELRNYKKKNGTQPLVLRISSGDKISRKNTGLYILEKEWDPEKHRVNRKHPRWTQLNDALDVLCKEAEGIKADIIRDRAVVTPKAVIKKVFATRDFYEAVQKKIESFGPEQAGSVYNYQKFITRVKAFAPTLAIEEITPELIEEFKTHLKTKGKGKDANGVWQGYSHNTVVETLTKMKVVLNDIDLKGGNPFDKVTVGSYKGAKVKELNLEDIQKIRTYIPRGKWESIAKDTFLFSFYAAGMRSSDVLQLRWSDIKGNRIVYDQQKKADTDKSELSIPLNQFTRDILARYDRSTPTVFNVLTLSGGSKAALDQRKKIQAAITTSLKLIAFRCGITTEVSFKLARTSFGRIANEVSGRNVYGIQQAMGHTKIATTEIYLGSDNRAVDELLQVVYAAG